MEVASTERAHRMQRRTSTEAMGSWMESMLCLYVGGESDDTLVEESVEDVEVEELEQSEDVELKW